MLVTYDVVADHGDEGVDELQDGDENEADPAERGLHDVLVGGGG